MRKLLFLIVAMFLMTTVQVSAASDEIRIIVNDREVEISNSNQKPYVNKDNRVMIPVRPVVTALGISDDGIKWDQETKTATVTNFVNEVQITLDESEVTVNGEVQKMDTAAEIKYGNIFLPARYLVEGLGYDVRWNQSENTVEIESYVDFTMIPNYLSEEDKQHYYDIQKYGTNLERFWGVPTEKIKIPYRLYFGYGMDVYIDKIVVFDPGKEKGPFTEIFTELMTISGVEGQEYKDTYYTVALHIDVKNPNYATNNPETFFIDQKLFAGPRYIRTNSTKITSPVTKGRNHWKLHEDPEKSLWYILSVKKDDIYNHKSAERLKRVLIKPSYARDIVELAHE